MHRCKILFLIFCCFANDTYAQAKLTLQQAIEIALKNNYSIIIARNESEITRNNATIGNAGMLPEVSLYASKNYLGSDTKQKYSNDTLLDKSGVTSDISAAGIAFTWTLFDGLKMFASYNRLQELQGMGELNAKIQVENSVEEVIVAYYSVVQQKQLLAASDSAITIYSERVRIAEEKLNIGSGSKSDLLQAKVDLNEQKSILLKQRSAITTQKLNLNHLLSQKVETEFDVEDDIIVNKDLKLAETKDSAMLNNKSILFYNRNIDASKYSMREAKSYQLPTISFNTAYNFSKTNNEVGFFLLNQNLGYNTGLTLSWTLFNGLNVRREISNAKLSLENAKLMLAYEKSQVESKLQAAYSNYLSALESLGLEEENSKLAQENSEIMLQRFKLASATSLDIKTAQQSYNDAISRLVQARYDAKVAETTLIKLKGELVK